MLGEEVTPEIPETNRPVDDSSAAGVGMLMMQLKAAQREAAEAEAAADAIDPDAACREMRARLTPMLDQRRAALAEALEEERRQADVVRAKARRAAEVMLAQVAAEQQRRAEEEAARLAEEEAARLADEEAARLAEEEAARLAEEEAARLAEEEAARSAVDPVEEGLDVVTLDDDVSSHEGHPEPEPAPETDPVWAVAAPTDVDDVWATTTDDIPVIDRPRDESVAPAPAAATAAPGSTTTNVVVDAEAFARVFATVIAQVLAERDAAPPTWPAVGPGWMPVAAAPPPPPEPKRSFWRHAWHADVVLLGIATVIVIVVLAAWLG